MQRQELGKVIFKSEVSSFLWMKFAMDEKRRHDIKEDEHFLLSQ